MSTVDENGVWWAVILLPINGFTVAMGMTLFLHTDSVILYGVSFLIVLAAVAGVIVNVRKVSGVLTAEGIADRSASPTKVAEVKYDYKKELLG
ncbi:hypothetical protein E4H12_05260 [Candidatus Thorarchaeota archaeon]|nr:MAG: hypothetical protein E4H12_05260 [Candidatus Thorarchaeota archaeon]